jgi:PAS domain S-box-containing protein
VYAGVFDEQGTPLAWLGPATEKAPSLSASRASELTRHDRLLRTVERLEVHGHHLGTLVVGYDLTSDLIEIKAEVATFHIGSLVLLFFGIAVAFVASNWLTRPLTELVRTMSSIASGRLDARADASSRDEFGALGAAFNSMVEQWTSASTELRRSEERFRSLVENLSEGVTIVDAHETILYSNRAADEIFGELEHGLVGCRLTDYLENGQLESMEREIEERRTGRRSIYELSIRRRDGQHRTIEITASPRASTTGTYDGAQGIFRDVTDRKLAEARLGESEDRLRLALEAAEMGTWSWDFETNRMVWSEQLERIFGLVPNGFGGDPEEYLRMIPGEEQRRARRTMYDALYGWTKDLHTITHRIRRPDGSIRWVEVRGTLYRLENGHPRSMAGTMADITHRRMTEGALEAIVRGTATTTGREFLQDLVRELSRALGVRLAFISRVVSGPSPMLRTLAVADQGTAAPQFECDLVGSPCEHVYGRKTTFFASGLRELFPASPMLHDIGAESYFGVPLMSSSNKPLGVLAVIGMHPIDDSDILSSIMTVFGARAAAELERMQVEEHVHLLAHAMMSISESVTIEDLTGSLIYANDAFEETYGYTRSEAIGRRRSELLSIEEPSGGGLADVAAWRGEQVHRRKSGSEFPAFLSTSVIPGEDGIPRGRVTIATDLTLTKQAEEQLRSTSEALRTVLEVSPLAILIVGEDRTVEFWNRAAEQMFGWGSVDVVGKPLPFVPAHLADAEVDMQDAVLGGGSITNAESQYRRKDGNTVDVAISATGLPDASGRIVRMMSIITDISERKRAEVELRKLSVAVDQSQVSIVMTDARGAIEYVNPFFTHTTGYAREEVLGQNPRILKSGTTPGEVYQDLWKTLSSGHEWHGELCNRRKNGDLYWEFASISPVRDSQGVTTHFIAVKEDITERRRSEEEVRRLNAELERRVIDRTAQLESANRELEAFSYSVSHDLRAPLRHVSGYVEMLRDHINGTLDPTSRRYLEAIMGSAKRMGILIDDLLAFSRLGRTELRRDKVDTAELVREVWMELEPDRVGRRIDLDSEELPTVQADRTLLKQVFANLLSNAIKFTRGRDEASVAITTLPADDGSGRMAFHIRDNGAGFDMAYADKLFGVFQRLHTVEEFEGTGIGLANVRRIVHRHGGKTWASAKPDAGATFSFTV